MTTPYQLSLLRRTFAAMALSAVAFTTLDALAAGNTVKLNGGNKNDECTFSSMSITPDGGVAVQCSGTTTTPVTNDTTETFVMSTSVISATANSVATFAVVRTGGSSAAFGATTVNFSYSGNGCAIVGTYPVAFAAGQMSSPIGAPLGASGTCTASLVSPPSPGVLGSPSSTVITLPGSPPPTTGVPAGCPALPQGMLNASFVGLGNPLLQTQASGQIVSIPLPSMPSSGQVTFGESAGGAYTPQPVTLEVTISRCPGLIDTDYSNRCNIRSTNGNYNSITWLAKTFQGRGGSINENTASANGLCWGGGSEQYYINARWSYATCAFGASVCGFAIQYNLGGY